MAAGREARRAARADWLLHAQGPEPAAQTWLATWVEQEEQLDDPTVASINLADEDDHSATRPA
jgi:hypothetical protein